MKKTFFYVLITFALIFLIFLIMQPLEIIYEKNVAMLNPKGIIALKQRNLLFIIQILMFIVVIPVFFIAFYFAWKYRESNKKAKYSPDWGENKTAEFIWWGVPFLLVAVIATLTWIKCIELDPYKPIESEKKPLKIQVVALDWKWLFIYPEEKIAVVNFLHVPVDTPLAFDITADAPMNSFWIPQLGGQIYAMPKMNTKLYLIADKPGDYYGSSANISGKGFAGMHFITKATDEKIHHEWVEEAKKSTQVLNLEEYHKLSSPSENNPVTLYKLGEENLFDWIIEQYKVPAKQG